MPVVGSYQLALTFFPVKDSVFRENGLPVGVYAMIHEPLVSRQAAMRWSLFPRRLKEKGQYESMWLI